MKYDPLHGKKSPENEENRRTKEHEGRLKEVIKKAVFGKDIK
jgi:hypothetical protein